MKRKFKGNDVSALRTQEDRIACYLYNRDRIGTLIVHFLMAAERGEAEKYYEEANDLLELLNR